MGVGGGGGWGGSLGGGGVGGWGGVVGVGGGGEGGGRGAGGSTLVVVAWGGGQSSRAADWSRADRPILLLMTGWGTQYDRVLVISRLRGGTFVLSKPFHDR